MQQQQEEQGPKSLRNVHLRQWEGNSKMTMLLAKASLGGMSERKKGPQGNRPPHGFVPRPRDPALRSSLLEFWQRPAAHLEERTHVGLGGWTRLSFHLPQWLERGTEWGEWGRGRGRWLWDGEKGRAGSIISYGDKENYPENSPNRLSGGGPTAPSYHSP